MTLRIGVVGTGAIGRDHMRRLTAVLPGAAIVAASDPGPGSARAALDAVNPDGTVFDDGHELVAASAVDAVLVTSLGSTHAEYVLAAIAAGKPVFCEKPLATTAADCRRIVDAEIAAAARNGGRRLVQVGFMRPFDAGYRQLREVVRSGAIGEPLMVHCAHRNAASLPYWTTEMAIADSLVHELDVLRWLLDDEYVSAQVVFPRRASHVPDTLRDPQVVLLETARGVRIDVELFMNCSYGYDIQCEVVAECGTARLPDPAAVTVRAAANRSTPVLVDWKQRFVDAYDTELASFVHGCRAGAIGGPSAWDGLAAAIGSDACLLAQRNGGVVPITMPERPDFYPPREEGHGG